MRIYPKDSFQRFEFDKLLAILSEHCRNSTAKQHALALKPIADYSEILILLEQTKEMLNCVQGLSTFPRFQFNDVQKEISLLKINNSILNEKQVLLLRDLSETSNDVLSFLADKEQIFPAIRLIFKDTYHTKEIVNIIDKVIDNAGIVKSSASKALATIRKNLYEVRKELDRVFRTHLQRYRKLGWIADTDESIYNGRRVLAVLAEQKRSVKGIVQGSSDTGKTSFIEPIETVDLNNDVFELEMQERREILRILKTLSMELRTFLPLIESYHRALISLDFTRAKALLANQLNATLPFVINKPEFNLIDASHPLLLIQNKQHGKPVVPFSCKLNERERMMIISGPNAGGKSITLKTIGLMQLMLQSGLLIPVKENSEIGIFKQILTDIGDNQSIEYELSTYSSRLQKMRYFLEHADAKSLVLIDEFGTGTDPELGGAVAEVILEELEQIKVKGVVTTHYTNIKIAADKLNGTFNACMVFNEHNLQPLYKLIVGQPGSSYTFVIAEKSGISKDLIVRARAKTDSDKVKLDQMLMNLQKEKQLANKSSQKFELQSRLMLDKQQEYNDLLEKWSNKMEQSKSTKEVQLKLAEAGRKFQLLYAEWEKSNDKKAFLSLINKTFNAEKKKKIDFKQQKVKEKKIEKMLEHQKEIIKVGSKVRLLNGKQTGIVESIHKNKAMVNFGAVITQAGLESIKLAE